MTTNWLFRHGSISGIVQTPTEDVKEANNMAAVALQDAYGIDVGKYVESLIEANSLCIPYGYTPDDELKGVWWYE